MNLSFSSVTASAQNFIIPDSIKIADLNENVLAFDNFKNSRHEYINTPTFGKPAEERRVRKNKKTPPKLCLYCHSENNDHVCMPYIELFKMSTTAEEYESAQVAWKTFVLLTRGEKP